MELEMNITMMMIYQNMKENIQMGKEMEKEKSILLMVN